MTLPLNDWTPFKKQVCPNPTRTPHTRSLHTHARREPLVSRTMGQTQGPCGYGTKGCSELPEACPIPHWPTRGRRSWVAWPFEGPQNSGLTEALVGQESTKRLVPCVPPSGRVQLS